MKRTHLQVTLKARVEVCSIFPICARVCADVGEKAHAKWLTIPVSLQSQAKWKRSSRTYMALSQRDSAHLGYIYHSKLMLKFCLFPPF